MVYLLLSLLTSFIEFIADFSLPLFFAIYDKIESLDYLFVSVVSVGSACSAIISLSSQEV